MLYCVHPHYNFLKIILQLLRKKFASRATPLSTLQIIFENVNTKILRKFIMYTLTATIMMLGKNKLIENGIKSFVLPSMINIFFRFHLNRLTPLVFKLGKGLKKDFHSKKKLQCRDGKGEKVWNFFSVSNFLSKKVKIFCTSK